MVWMQLSLKLMGRLSSLGGLFVLFLMSLSEQKKIKNIMKEVAQAL